MAIIGTLPNNIQNGQAVDANPVMADFNYIVNQVNANAAPSATAVTTGSTASLSTLTTTSGGSALAGNVTVSSSAQLNLTVTSTGSSSYQKFVNSSGAKYVGSVANNFVVVNNANTAILLTVDDAGNLTATGNITANSDERLKKDWAPLPDDFLERLASVQTGTYTRISTGERNVGVPAQGLQGALPEAVQRGLDGYLSVAYGNAALAAVIELTREVLRLRALLEPAK